IANMIIGILALLTGKTGEIITIACFGALTLYIVSMIAFFSLRKNHTTLTRPFRVPMYPYFPAIALTIAIVAFVAMSVYNAKLLLIYIAILALGYVGYRWYQKN
ncbi:MAG: ethanolamine permease, partial [Bacteroidota bacterium]